MNRDKLNIPEFIQRYLVKNEGFMWNTVPIIHQCGYSYFRLPTFYSRDFLYRKNYISEVIQFLDTDFEDLCPKCSKPLGNENRFEIAFIDLDSNEVFIYKHGNTDKWGWSDEFVENGYKVQLFKPMDTFKESLIERYKTDIH